MITCRLKNAFLNVNATDYKIINAFESIELQFIGNNPNTGINALIENQFYSISYEISLTSDAFINMMTYRSNNKHPRNTCIK